MGEVNGAGELKRFGIFEADLNAGELRKNGRKVRVQDLPFRLLEVLLERPGEVVTREELRDRLWPADTFVEFEHSLNAAVAKLRAALGDSADSPRFVETIPRRGYRFLADVETIGGGLPGKDVKDGALPRRNSRSGHRWQRAAVAAGFAVVTGALIWFLTRQPRATTDNSLVAVPLTAYPGSESQPSFSPDGSAVTFVWNGPDGRNTDIYVKTIGAEKPRRLTTHPAEDVSPAWSPDGTSIAFVRRFPDEDKVEYWLVTPTASDPERKLLEGPHLYWQPTPWLAWSPDSKWLALIDRDSPEEEYALYLVSVETLEKRRLPSPPKRGMVGAPAFSPDGRTLVLLHRPAAGVNDFYRIGLSDHLEPTGDPLLLHAARWECDSPVFTADGKSIIFSAQAPAPGLWQLRVFEPDTPRMLNVAGWSLARGGGPPIFVEGSSFAISPSANRLAFTQGKRETNIWRLELSSAGVAVRRRRLISSTRIDSDATYSPDGKQIVFISDRSGTEEIWTCDSNGDQLMKLTSMAASRIGWPHWSPDGRRISFDSTKEGQWEVYVVNSDGGPSQRVTHHSSMNATASWSHDGRWIYFTSHRSGNAQVWKMPADRGETTQMTRQGGSAPFESPDGEFVYYFKRANWGKAGTPGSLWKVPVKGGAETLVQENVKAFNYCLGSNGIYFVVYPEANEKPTIQFLDYSSGVTRVVAELDNPVRAGLSVSPDGRYLLYTQTESSGSDLMLVENFR